MIYWLAVNSKIRKAVFFQRQLLPSSPLISGFHFEAGKTFGERFSPLLELNSSLH